MQRQLAIGIGLLAAVLLVGTWWWFRQAEAPPEPAEFASTPPPVEEQPMPREAEVPPALPALEGSDTLARDELFALGVAEPLAGLISTEQIVRTAVVAVNAIAAGRSPRQQLPFLEPDGYFEVTERGAGLWVDPESYRRYDGFASAIDSLDADAAVRSYLRLEALADQAYAELGIPGRFRDRLLEAIDHLLDAPILRGEIEVEDAIDRYRFADPELENLSDAQKHLIRTGPDNQERIQQQLRRVRDSLLTAD